MPHATEIPANDPTHMESSISSPIPIPSIPSTRTHAWNEQPISYSATAPTSSSAAPIETTTSLEYNTFLTSLLSSEEIPIDVYGGSYSSDEIDDQLYQASSLISDPKKFEDPSFKCCGLVLEDWQALYRHSQTRHSSDNLPVEDLIGSVTPTTEVFSTSPYLNLSPQSAPKTPRDGQNPRISDVMETSTVTALASSSPATKKSQYNATAQNIAQSLVNNYQRAQSLWALENCNPHNITCQRQLSQSLPQFDSDNAMELLPALAANQEYVIPGLLHQSNIGGISMTSPVHNVAGNASVGMRFSDPPLLSNIGTALVDYNDPQRRRSAPSILPSTTTQYTSPIDLMSVPYTPNYTSSSAMRQITVSPTAGYPASEDITPVSLSHANTLTTRCELNNLTSPTSAPSSLSINTTRFTNIDVLVASPTEICDHDITSTFAFNSSTNSAFATTGHTVSLADVYSGPPGTSKPSKKKSRNTASGQSINNAQTCVPSNTCWVRNNDMNASRNEQNQDAPVHAPRGLKRTQSCPTDSTATVNKRRTMQSSPDASAIVKTSTVAEAEASKPFRCTVVGCPKTYKNANGLKYHKAHGHSTQAGNGDRCAEKPYKCDIDGCTKAYKNPNGLKYHLDHHHPGYIKPTSGLKYHLDHHNSGRGLQVINTAVVGAAQQIPISQ